MKRTDRFLKRAWERGIPTLMISKIECILLNNDNYKVSKNKTRLIIGKDMIKELGIESKSSALVIIIKDGFLLITTFFIDNIWGYCESSNEEIETILM